MKTFENISASIVSTKVMPASPHTLAREPAFTASPLPPAAVPPTPAAPWWKHGHVWLVISGPAAVVVAGVVTAVLAVQGADKLVAEDYYRRGLQINSQLASERAQLPAQQARNHAATPTR